MTNKSNILKTITKINSNTMEEYTESSYNFIKLINKRKTPFAVVTVFAIFAAALFSSEWFIKPKFKSFAIIYPSNITPYSEESTSEQMLQLLGSADIRNAVVQKFNLYKYYKIDSLDPTAPVQMAAVYQSNVEISRTQFESVEIVVLDEDPKRAADIVTEIINAMNLKARALQRDKTKEVEVVVKNQLDLKKHTIDSIEIRLHELRVKYQLFDYKIQAKEVTKSYLKAVGAGGRNLKEIDVMMRNLEEKGGEYYELNNTLDALLKSYNKTKIEYDVVLRDLNKELTYANIITKPTPSFKKAYPVRWLIVLASVISANLFLFVLLLILDNRKK
jgi:hypothetical protein